MTVEPRCSYCRLEERECVCESLATVRPQVRLAIIQHHAETLRQSNTGALLTRVVEGTTFWSYGLPGLPFRTDERFDPDADHWVLFPEPGARVLAPDLLLEEPLRPKVLVVLDATWRQARRMACRIAGLRKHRFVTLPLSPEPAWSLRRPLRKGQVGTAESVARAYAALGDAETSRAIAAAIDAVAPRILGSRGRRGGSRHRKEERVSCRNDTGS